MQNQLAGNANKTEVERLQNTYLSLPSMLYDRVAKSSSLEAFRYPDGESWKTLTWRQTGQRIRDIAAGLLHLGLRLEERCGVLSGTRLEWIFADLATVCAGGATTTVYPSNTASECAYIIGDADCQLVFVEDAEQVAKLRSVRDTIPSVKHIVVFDGEGDCDWVMTLEELMAFGRSYNEDNPTKLDDIAAAILPNQLATLIYTSGTTGQPKGVRLLHSCWVYEAESVHTLGLISEDDTQYLWLPLAHVFGKVLIATQLRIGFSTAVDGRIPKLVENLAVIQPTFMAAAPRIFEKVYNKVIAGAKAGGTVKYGIFKWALGVGRQVSAQRQKGQEPSGILAIQNKVANALVFSKLKATFGGRVKFFISGSAPLSREIAEFFHAADVLILEGYGLTESSAASFVNIPQAFKFGTVGHALPGTECKIAEEDGEILLRGPGIMSGYHNLPEVTANVLTDDGWFHTGDIGEMDADGYLKITDRKKDLIKTSGGKYVAPQLLEGRFKSLCPYASQIVVHGDRRNYCSALIALDEEALLQWAKDNNKHSASYVDLVKTSEVHGLIAPYIDKLNEGLPSYETIKKFLVLPKDLTIEDGELTPSLKVKRKVVEKKYMELLDSMYSGSIQTL